jgi:L-seryl-tRNA(Ser) seleniumtransferase
MRVDKVTMAALEATTEIHLGGTAMTEIPLLRMIARPADQVLEDCRTVISKLPPVPGVNIAITATDSQVGGGSLPGVNIPSHAIQISGLATDDLARALRLGIPAVQSRVTDDSLLLDLRSVPESELELLTARLRDALTSP